MQVPNGTGPGVRRSKRPLLASRSRCNVLWKPPKFDNKVKIGNKVQFGNKFANWCNVWSIEGVIVHGHVPERHVTFGRGRLHNVWWNPHIDHKVIDDYIRRFIYKFLNVCPFDYTAVAGSGKVGPVNEVNHTSWVAVVTPTDRPKSVLNRCVIELFCGVVCVVTLPFWHFCWCRGFCHRTELDLFLFLIKLTEGRFQTFNGISLSEELRWKSRRP